MGLVQLPAVEKLDPFLRYSPIVDKFARQHFWELSHYIKLREPGYDKLGKAKQCIPGQQIVNALLY